MSSQMPRPARSRPWWPRLPRLPSACILGSLLDQWSKASDDPRDRGLLHVEDVGPYFLDDVLTHVPEVTTSASRNVSPRGRPVPLSQGFPRSSATRSSSSSSCSS